jgi:hypothetical protein
MLTSQIEVLMRLGLSEMDAWHCVHRVSGESGGGRGPDTFVLLQGCEDTGLLVPHPFMGVSARQIAAAAEHGVAWRQARPGEWQYLRRIDWCVEQLAQLELELECLSTSGLLLTPQTTAPSPARGRGSG